MTEPTIVITKVGEYWNAKMIFNAHLSATPVDTENAYELRVIHDLGVGIQVPPLDYQPRKTDSKRFGNKRKTSTFWRRGEGRGGGRETEGIEIFQNGYVASADTIQFS